MALWWRPERVRHGDKREGMPQKNKGGSRTGSRSAEQNARVAAPGRAGPRDQSISRARAHTQVGRMRRRPLTARPAEPGVLRVVAAARTAERIKSRRRAGGAIWPTSGFDIVLRGRRSVLKIQAFAKAKTRHKLGRCEIGRLERPDPLLLSVTKAVGGAVVYGPFAIHGWRISFQSIHPRILGPHRMKLGGLRDSILPWLGD